MPRAIQLKDYYTGQPAPEVDRVRIQAKIDELRSEMVRTYNIEAVNALRFRIMVLSGDLRPLRS